MIIDEKRLNKIGIDRIVLNNFKIANFESLEKKQTKNNDEYTEKIEIETDSFKLIYSVKKIITEELYTIASLAFNPNKIRDGNNIYNSSVSELQLQLDKIVQMLLKKGVWLDLTAATVKEIELNTTFKTSFEKFHEVLLLIGRANFKNALGMYSFNEVDIPAAIKHDRILYLNHNLGDKKDLKEKVIKFYDKTFELKREWKMELDYELTRVEVACGRDYYRRVISKYGLTNSIYDLKDSVLEDIFKKALENELVAKTTKYMEKIKSNLVYDFFNFKRNEKVKREARKKLESLGKEIPDHLKETRGVLEYLDKESWIFDYSFLQELVLKEIHSKHKGNYLKQIENKYKHKKNKEVYEKLLEHVFLR